MKDRALRHWQSAALLLAAAFALYANTFGAAWSHDDFPVLVENADIRSLSAFLADRYPGRPLRELTFLLDYQLFGLQPAGYHVQNIFWHALNAILLWHLAVRLGAASRVAWLAALLFLAHPLQVEVVANISHRKDSLALAFALLALLAYLRGRREDALDWRWLVVAAGLWGVALTAKQNVVVLPGALAGYELLYRGGWRRLWHERPVLLAGLLATGAGAAVLVVRHVLAGQELSRTMAGMLLAKTGASGPFSVASYYGTVLKGWFFSWSRLLWPRDLAIEYYFPAARGLAEAEVLAALLLVVLLVLAAALAWRRQPLLAFGLGWFLLFWLPTSNLLPQQIYFAADRYLYAPSAGALLAVAVAVDGVCRDRRFLLAAALCLLLPLALLTWRQNRVWHTEESLWRQAVAVSPRSSFALNNLGNIHLLKGELPEAMALYEQSCRVDPYNPTAFYNLGMLHEQAGSLGPALDYYRRFLALDSPLFRREADALRRRLGGLLGAAPQP